MAGAELRKKNAPNNIKFDSIVVDLCFHPEKDIIAAGDIDGDICLYAYSTSEDNRSVMTLNHHKKACRCIRFSPSGNNLITASKDKSLCLVDMNQGTVKRNIEKAHKAPLYSVCVVDDNIIASGDDDGTFKVWDMRQAKEVMNVKENDEFISDMVVQDRKRLLLATSGDGTLSAFDIRKHKMRLQSELFDSELLSVAIMKGGDKVICGSGEGVVNIFNWGEWGNISDRFPGHPMSIDCMVPFTDNIVFTGSFDGKVRAVNILPNRFLAEVGEHNNFPVENMSLSRCRTLLASCSHDQQIAFWNVSDVQKEKVDASKKVKKNDTRKLNQGAANTPNSDFFAGLQETSETEKKKDGEGTALDGDSDSESDLDNDDNDDDEELDSDEDVDEEDGDTDEDSDASNIDRNEG